MNQTNIYLTPEVQAYTKANQNPTLGDLVSVTTTQAVSFILVVIVFTGMIYFLRKTYAGANLGGVSSSKEGLRRVGGALLAVVVVMGVFSYLGILGKIQELTSLGATASNQSAELTKPMLLVTETDAGAGPVIPSGNQGALLEMMKATEKENRSVLTAQKISINTGPCTTVGQTGCTSVGGMSNITLAMLAKLKKDCACDVTVSGGTEWWLHSASTKHKPGNVTAVDLHKSSTLDPYIKSVFTKQSATRSTCFANYSWNGFVFCDEKSAAAHWHVQPL